MRTLLLTLTVCLLALPACAAWPLYEPVAEVVLPPGDVNVPRAVAEKDGYVYVLAREGILYTYELSDLPLRTSFATYNTPVRKLALYNGNGILRRGDYLYAFGGSGIETIEVRDPSVPVLLGLSSDLKIYNLVRHEDYLIAAGAERLVVYSLAEPWNPTLLSDLNLGEGELVWSVAGYGRTLYACHWWSDWQGTYVDTLSMIDFSDPASLSVLNSISRDDQAYHLRVIGDRLLECTSNQVGLWDLTAPANPVLLTSQQAGGRVAAQNGEHIVTNGTVFRPNGNELQLVATFKPGDSQHDGYPHGSAVNASFVFLAQSKRVLVLNAQPPVLAINHASGGPGSFFTITGHGFASEGKATILVNGHALGEIATDAAGDCLFVLDTEQAGEGHYVVTTTAHPGTSVSFVINSEGPVYPLEGGETIFQIPSGIAYAKYSGGTGEPNDPYQIATADDLIALGETPEDYDKHFILTADIDLDPNLPGRKVFDKAVIASSDVNDVTGWRYDETSFTGVFDGNSHTISHLMIEGDGYLGLFGRLAYRAEVKNLGVLDVNITGSGDCVGGLIGFSYGLTTVTQCYSTGEVSGSDCVGGLVGLNLRTPHVTQCYSTATVNGSDYVGGLVGQNGGTVIYCYSAGAVTGIGDYVGGLVGTNFYGDNFIAGSGTVTLSLWDTQTSGQVRSRGGTGKTTAEMQTASTFLGWGGVPSVWTIDEDVDYPRLAWERKPGIPLPALADFIAGSGTQEESYLICTSDDLNTIGVFFLECDKHFKLMADIDLSGITYSQAVIPDFAGMFDGNGHTVSHLTIVGQSFLGLFGVLREGAEIRNLGVMDVNISGTGDNIGALAGYNGYIFAKGGIIASSYSTGTVSGRDSVGGLVGYNNGIVTGCHNDGLVTGSGQGVGGLVGKCYRDSDVSYCCNTGEVLGDSKVGGLVGSNYGTVTQCFYAGAVGGRAYVAGKTYVGGLVGSNEWSSGIVTQCYSTRGVNGQAWVGGLVGSNGGIITQCYSTGVVAGMVGSGGATSGGLVGRGLVDRVTACFWDIQTSERNTSAGGTGKTTVQMQRAQTFLEAGWDFVGETVNGTEDIWWILEGKDYPHLWWETK